jgi:uncharacterized DUF497 family protein
VYEWDEAKREANLKKHGLDFFIAHKVFESPDKFTIRIRVKPEERFLDVALVESKGTLLARFTLFAAEKSDLYHSVPPGERKGEPMSLPNRDMTDWDRVRRSIELDEPIPYDANDPDDGPYDPNDEAATEAFMTEAEILTGYSEQRVIKAAGVPIDEWEEPIKLEARKKRAKAS